MTGSLPMSPEPKSVSSPQIATSTSCGTPNCRSMRDSSAACRCSICVPRLIRPGADAGRHIFLEALAERAALAAVERQHRLVLGHAA